MTGTIYLVDDKTTVVCPVCSRRQAIDARPYVKQKSAVEIVSSCTCGQTWTSRLERRRHFRKTVKLKGRYSYRNEVRLSEGTPAGSFVGKGKMRVVDLSLRGLKIELKNTSELHINDLLAVEFRLKDKKRTLIRENAAVKSINGRYVGGAFGPSVAENSSLGFFLMG